MDGREKEFVLWFEELGIDDVPIVGGKNASLGEMYQNLTNKGIRVPNGFAITAHAYRYLIEDAKVGQQIEDILNDLDTSDMKNLQERGHKVRDVIRGCEFPDDLKEAIFKAYEKMCEQYADDHVDVAVRSSATAEDLPDASFAGQQETYLNVRGKAQLIDACKRCFASLFTNRAISYRVDKNFGHFDVYLSIAVQKMVRSDKASSGVMFSIDTESGFQNVVFITGAWGLGENVVQGAVTPDEFYVFKPTLKDGKKPIISRTLGAKKIKMVYSHDGNELTKNIEVPKEDRRRYSVTDDEVIELAKWAVAIEEHYSEKAGHYKPMDIEWAKDGISGELFIVQARPETVMSRKTQNMLKRYVLEEESQIIIEGESVGSRIGAGKANIIKDVHDIGNFKKGDVLVTDMTDPDWEPIMKIASAIVTNRGGRTCHAAIISRELGIPCVIGTDKGTESIYQGREITVSCAQGEKGYVYDGLLKFHIDETDIQNMPETRTKIMMNIGMPENAFEQSFIPNDGVGLAREEFIINSYIGIHPKALMEFENIKDEKVRQEIEELTVGYTDKTEFFIDKLAMGVSRIAAAFYPKDVILRCSDFKSNEYANLVGGNLYEPKEHNPMIGWRGASRYYDDHYRQAFALECKAIKRIRDDMGLTNLKVMIPFCRTVDEGRKVLSEMESHGLKRGEAGLEVYVMCEIPSNVILADKFAEIFDGFSIGSNDLTQLTLGLDRDSELVAHIYDERNDAVKRLISQVIKTAKQKGRKIGICGQAPSDFPEFAQFLVECGIDSISLNPDTVIKTKLKIAEKESQLEGDM